MKELLEFFFLSDFKLLYQYLASFYYITSYQYELSLPIGFPVLIHAGHMPLWGACSPSQWTQF